MARATFGIPGMRISGKLWGAVLVERPDGTTVLRQLPERKPRRTEAQDAAAARFRPVGEAWHALSREDAAAWRAFAGGTGREAYLRFTALASKCLQMRPGAPVPNRPPTSGFQGDGIEVVAEATGLEKTEFPSPAPPQREGTLAIRFIANGANAPGVVTELMLQRLANPNRMPERKAYRGRTFVAFAASGLAAEVPVERGTWACAVRFVREATGQEAAIVEIGVVEV